MIVALRICWFDLENEHLSCILVFKIILSIFNTYFILVIMFLSIEVHFCKSWYTCFLTPVQAQITAYVEYFGQCTSEHFPEDIAEVFFVSLFSLSCSYGITICWISTRFLQFVIHISLLTCMWFWQLIRNRYPSKEKRLFDDVLGIDSLTILIYKTINYTCWVSYQ